MFITILERRNSRDETDQNTFRMTFHVEFERIRGYRSSNHLFHDVRLLSMRSCSIKIMGVGKTRRK